MKGAINLGILGNNIHNPKGIYNSSGYPINPKVIMFYFIYEMKP